MLFSVGVAEAQIGPDYERPPSAVTERFKNVTWRVPCPAAHLSKGKWWEIFRDSKLNELEERASAENQQVKGAVARFDQARTTARITRGNLFPEIGATGSAERQRTSANMPSAFPLDGLRYDGPAYNVLGDFSWEIDLWGRIRRSIQADEASMLAAADTVHNVLLGVQAEVAATYFQIRSLDAEIAIVREAVGWRGEALKIARARVNAGAANDLETAQSETEVASAEAEIFALKARRDELENALAILVGANASAFSISPRESSLPGPPKIPAGIPSDLLERRPDIAAAEHQLVAATAKIGVAKAEAFPSLILAGNGGYQSGDLDILFEPASLMWNYGPKLRVPVFSGGKNRFNISRSMAMHDEALAAYRQAFLVAIADVETSLSTLRHLANQADSLGRAAESARRGANLARTQYQAGSGAYLDVINANRSALVAEVSVERVAGQRLVAAVSLVKAIGGGWDQQRTLDLPKIVADPVAKSDPKVEEPLLKRLFKKRE